MKTKIKKFRGLAKKDVEQARIENFKKGFIILTKEEVEQGRCKAYEYLIK